MKKKILFPLLFAAIVLALSAALWMYIHPTHYRFNDRAVLGSTETAIVEKYGAFSTSRRSEDGILICGAYMVRDNTPELIMSYDNSLWYEIYFEDGIAVSVRLQEGRYGG